ncbi:unnamed protein product [Dovyalis caffra]|uniref:Uncharacterized protein n=1 Tax=Dovyalis caffra TaxID=77055 RepID=A0AAV1RGB7_9ROSI|nr:unnamed protein product [Dovyalis caffra]
MAKESISSMLDIAGRPSLLKPLLHLLRHLSLEGSSLKAMIGIPMSKTLGQEAQGTGLTATSLIERVRMRISHGTVTASFCPTLYAIDVIANKAMASSLFSFE